LDKSGTGGHSVFNMYRLRSGIEGQGGTVDFNTYLLKSGSRHGGHIGLGFGQPQGAFCWQELQVGITSSSD